LPFCWGEGWLHTALCKLLRLLVIVVRENEFVPSSMMSLQSLIVHLLRAKFVNSAHSLMHFDDVTLWIMEEHLMPLLCESRSIV